MVSSAGTHGLHGNMADAFAIQAAAAHGVDISGHRARMLDAKMIRSADLVLAMEKQHIRDINSQLLFPCKHVKLLGEFAPRNEPLEIEDPYGSAFEDYKTTANGNSKLLARRDNVHPRPIDAQGILTITRNRLTKAGRCPCCRKTRITSSEFRIE